MFDLFVLSLYYVLDNVPNLFLLVSVIAWRTVWTRVNRDRCLLENCLLEGIVEYFGSRHYNVYVLITFDRGRPDGVHIETTTVTHLDGGVMLIQVSIYDELL